MTEEETVTRPLEDGNMLDQMQKAKRQSESFQKPSYNMVLKYPEITTS